MSASIYRYGRGRTAAAKLPASDDRTHIETIGSLPFAAISLTHDGTRFWTNDRKATSIVAFTFPL